MRNFQNKVWVIRLWKWNNFQIELCIFKHGVTIDWHQHKDCDVEVMHIYGNAFYDRCHPSTSGVALQTGEGCVDSKHCYVTTFGKDGAFLKRFSVPAYYWHMAIVGVKPLITLSIQRWKSKPSLITEDYHENL